MCTEEFLNVTKHVQFSGHPQVVILSLKQVMEMAGYKRSLLKTIRKRQLHFWGHINRAGGLEKQIWSGKICGSKSRGRQRKKYTDSLNNFVTRKESPNNELIRRTDDREGWKAMIADVCNRPGK